MLWLTRMTPRPVSRSRSIRLRTSAVCATPRAAVGSSSMTTFRRSHEAAGDRDGLPLATGQRGDRDAHRGDLGERVRQPPRLLLHGHLVEPARGPLLLAQEEVGPTSRLSHRARSWNTVEMPSACASLGPPTCTTRPANVIVAVGLVDPR